MVPDFRRLRKPSTAIAPSQADAQPLKPNPDGTCSQLQSFSSTFHEKVLHPSSTSLDSRPKSIESTAKPMGFQPKSQKSTAPITATGSTPTQTVTDEGKATQRFYELWLAQPSWSPIIKKADGWITIVNRSGKKVPLVLGTVESHYRRGIVLGKRFGKLTNYLLIDVDTGSPFHPRNGGLKPILTAMEALGLCRYLLIRSSKSGGLHVYFPLAEPVSAWGLACAAHAALTTAGITIAGGICELFPNKKAFNAEHNGHRLPLQDGSFILDDDFHCISNHKTVFLQQWQLCAAQQDEALLAELLTEKPVAIPQRIAVSSLPPITWTGSGQSNEVMKQLVNYGDRYLGLNTIPALGDWMVAVAPQLPGFTQFASEESRNDLTRRGWAYRWAKCHFNSVRQHAAKTSVDHNAMVAAEALARLMVALDKLVAGGKLGVRKLWATLSGISKALFGVGFSWGLFQKHRKLIIERVKGSRSLGLSKKKEEGKRSSLVEVTGPLNPEPKEHLPELLTGKSVTSSNDKVFRASRPPSKRESLGALSEGESAAAAEVIFQRPGSDGKSVETRVTGQVIRQDEAALYQIEARPEDTSSVLAEDKRCCPGQAARSQAQEGAIRATAVQLLQVLGQACPFVGPGLWTVRRDEVSPKAWGQLCRLVGEG